MLSAARSVAAGKDASDEFFAEMAERTSELSAIPSPSLEKHKLEVENLKWQIEYEKKLHDKLSQILENKVSGLMAQVKRMQKEIDSQKTTITEQSDLTAAQADTIQELEGTIKRGQE